MTARVVWGALVVWLSWQQLALADVVPLGSQFAVKTMTGATYTDVCSDPSGKFVTAWVDRNGLSVQRFDSSGLRVGSEIAVAPTVDKTAPALCCSANGAFVVAWNAEDDDDNGVFAQRFSNAGIADGPAFQVNTTSYKDQEEVSLCCGAAGNFAVAWQSDVADGDQEGIFVQRYGTILCVNGMGQVVGTCPAAGTPSAACAAAGGELCIADVAQPVGGELRVNTTTEGHQTNPDLACDPNDNFVVVWEGEFGDQIDIGAQRFNAASAPVGGEIIVNQQVDQYEREREPSVCTEADGDFTVAWEGRIDDRSAIFAHRFASDTTRLGSSFIVNEYDGGREPSLACRANGGFLATWAAAREDTSQRGIFAREFAADGNPTGHEFRVNTAIKGNQRFPSLSSIAANDSFVFAWASENQGVTDPYSYSVYAQRGAFSAAAFHCPSSPDVTCRTATEGRLMLKKDAVGVRDTLRWLWTKGQASTLDDFGVPSTGTEYRLCLYDNGGLKTEIELADGAPLGGTGFWTAKVGRLTHRDRTLIRGIKTAKLKASSPDTNNAAIAIAGKGTHLSLPIAGSTLLTPPVSVQLFRSGSPSCWGASYSGAQVLKNSPAKFAASTSP